MHLISPHSASFALKPYLATFMERWSGWIRPR